ncbi:hypothetical protein BX264_5427 [Streptomyces sp. 2333.5]|nr:hypothetical protein BX264_5427 [Streptomyces sp. 2333.5]SEE65789.1 hypothetical protein SAMN05428943_5551 [Streptomyces sp. 2314.4]SEE92016.1 hypothetical protein SAMN05428942_5527 [Streptomyces sp. 2112.2]
MAAWSSVSVTSMTPVSSRRAPRRPVSSRSTPAQTGAARTARSECSPYTPRPRDGQSWTASCTRRSPGRGHRPVPSGRHSREPGFRDQGRAGPAVILRALASRLPIVWEAGDCVYGQDWRMRRTLEEAGVGYVWPCRSPSSFTPPSHVSTTPSPRHHREHGNRCPAATVRRDHGATTWPPPTFRPSTSSTLTRPRRSGGSWPAAVWSARWDRLLHRLRARRHYGRGPGLCRWLPLDHLVALPGLCGANVTAPLWLLTRQRITCQRA